MLTGSVVFVRFHRNITETQKYGERKNLESVAPKLKRDVLDPAELASAEPRLCTKTQVPNTLSFSTARRDAAAEKER